MIRNSSIRPSLVAICLAALASAQPASAQTLTADSADRGAPIGDTGRAAPIKVEISAGTADKQASVKVNLLQLLDGSGASNPSQLTLSVSTPWDGQNDAEPLNLDGLSSGTKFKLNYTFFRSSEMTGASPRSVEIEAQARALCAAKADQTAEQTLADMGSNATADARAAAAKAHEAALKKCETADGAAVVKEHLRGSLRDYVTGFFKRDAWAFDLHGAIGTRKFEYLDTTTLATLGERKVGWSFGLGYTRYFRRSPTAVTLGFDYEEAYKDRKAQIFCPPATGPNPVQCVQGPPGAPNFDRSAIVRFNLRHRVIGPKGKTRFAVSPNVFYDVSDSEFAAELPIYFIPGKDDSLTGGVKIGYTSESKDVTFGVFIGVAFGLWD